LKLIENQVPDKNFSRQVYNMKRFEVDTEMTFKEEIVRSNGDNPWFVNMSKESSDAPWLIDSIGTGP
jgi:hypothetical protein